MNGLDILIVFILLIIGYLAGSLAEKRHYKNIQQRERQTLQVPIINFGAKHPLPEAQQSQLFVGSVVISIDYFKRISAALRNLVGGRIVVYESLLDRGRREALLRLKEQAMAWGATQVVNVRLETATIGGRSDGNSSISLGSIEVIAYGTGIR
jgi:uncharacterized protein YbjQ (UPF0145 family)